MEINDKIIEEKAVELRRAYNRERVRKFRATHPNARKEYEQKYWRKKAIEALASENAAKNEE